MSNIIKKIATVFSVAITITYFSSIASEFIGNTTENYLCQEQISGKASINFFPGKDEDFKYKYRELSLKYIDILKKHLLL